MHETCFCGRNGSLADRTPIYVGDGEWALACPDCGRLDRLAWLPTEARHALLAEAAERARVQQPERPARAA